MDTEDTRCAHPMSRDFPPRACNCLSVKVMGLLLAQLRASFEVIPIQGIEQPIYPERRLLVMIFTVFCGLAYFVWGLGFMLLV